MKDVNTTSSEDNNKMTYNEFLNKYNTMRNKRTAKDSGADNTNSDILYGVKSNNSSSSSLNSSCSSNTSNNNNNNNNHNSNKVPYTSYQEYLRKYETKKFAPVKLSEPLNPLNTTTETRMPPNGTKSNGELVNKPKICVKSELVVQITSNGNSERKQKPIVNKQPINVQNFNNVAVKLSENFNNQPRPFNNKQMSPNSENTGTYGVKSNSGTMNPSTPLSKILIRNKSPTFDEQIVIVNKNVTSDVLNQEQSVSTPQVLISAPPPPPPPMPTSNTITRPPPIAPKMTTCNLLPSYATLPRKSATNSPKPKELTTKDLLLDELMSKTKRYDPPETNTNNLQRTSSSPIASSPKLMNTPAQLPNICTLPRPTTVKMANKTKFPLPSPTLTKKFPIQQIKPNQNVIINKVSNEEAKVTTVITVNDNVDSVTRTDPNVKKYVYNTYRGLLGAYNNKANEFISNTTGIIVKEDKGVSKQLESLALHGGLDKLNGRLNPGHENE